MPHQNFFAAHCRQPVWLNPKFEDVCGCALPGSTA